MRRSIELSTLVSAAIALAAFAPTTVHAHPLSFGVLHLTEHPSGRVDLTFRYSGSESDPTGATPRLPDRCHPLTEPTTIPVDNGVETRAVLDCGDDGLAGSSLGVDGLTQSGAQVLARVERPGAELVTAVLSSDDDALTVPTSDAAASVFAPYLALGVEHILTGLDHLAFVLVLVLLVAGARRRFFAVTAFTLGHSVTLALATLGVVHVPAAPVEAVIALSIVLLAAELAKPDESRPWTARHPEAVAAAFGLLHGLGFAGALGEIGVPDDAIVPALFAFNVGVELGQLAFVLVVVASIAAAARWRDRIAAPARAATAYAVGTLAVFWCFARLSAFWIA